MASPQPACRKKASKTASLYRSILRLGSCSCAKPDCDSFPSQDESASKELCKGNPRISLDAAPTRCSSAAAAALSVSFAATAAVTNGSSDSNEAVPKPCDSGWKSEPGLALENMQGADPSRRRVRVVRRSMSEISISQNGSTTYSSPRSSRGPSRGELVAECPRRSYEAALDAIARNTATSRRTRLGEHRRRHSANQSDIEALSDRQVDLLHQVLPPKVANALKEDQQLAPERFDDVTIFQSDIVGFTQIASQLHAKEVYSLLDTLYRKFDVLAEKYRLYKIETIGDAYICVGGLPRARADHARSVVAFAVEAVRVASETPVRTPGGIKYLQIRAGIHSGGILACVTSSLNPRYSLLGETLQWAQGLEQAAKPNFIKASALTHTLLEEQSLRMMPAETSENTEIKGRGSLQCVTLDPRHPILLALGAEEDKYNVGPISRTQPMISLSSLPPSWDNVAMTRARSFCGRADGMATSVWSRSGSMPHDHDLELTNLDLRAEFNESVDAADGDRPANIAQPTSSMVPSAADSQSWDSHAEPLMPGSLPKCLSKRSLPSVGRSLDSLPEDESLKGGLDALPSSSLGSLIPSGWNETPASTWMARDSVPAWMNSSMPVISLVPDELEDLVRGTPDGNGNPGECFRTEPSYSPQQPSSMSSLRPHIQADLSESASRTLTRAKSRPPGNPARQFQRAPARANSSIGFARGSAVPAVSRDRELLNKMLPKEVVATLMRGEKVKPEEISDVSLIFCGIVGYKELELQLPPEKTHDMLLRLFKKLDRIVTKYELYKVETVADEYVVAGNLTLRAHTHAFRACGFVLEALKAARGTLVDEDDPSQGYVQIRAGINIGNVIASVVGTLTPRYCLFGDAMNMAARMKSASDPDQVTLSPAMAKALTDSNIRLSLTSQGLKSIKGKGVIECFTLDETEENASVIKNHIRRSDDGYSARLTSPKQSIS